MQFVSAQVDGRSEIRGGLSGDEVIFGDVTLHRRVGLRTFAGTDSVSIATTTEVTSIRLLPITETVLRDGRTVMITHLVPETRTTIIGGSCVAYHGKVKMQLGRGDDTLQLKLDAQVAFQRKSSLDSKTGFNHAYVNCVNLPAIPRLKRFHVTQGRSPVNAEE